MESTVVTTTKMTVMKVVLTGWTPFPSHRVYEPLPVNKGLEHLRQLHPRMLHRRLPQLTPPQIPPILPSGQTYQTTQAPPMTLQNDLPIINFPSTTSFQQESISPKSRVAISLFLRVVPVVTAVSRMHNQKVKRSKDDVISALKKMSKYTVYYLIVTIPSAWVPLQPPSSFGC